MSGEKKRPGKTASELLRSLSENSEFQKRQSRQDANFADLRTRYQAKTMLLIEELRRIGFDVASLKDLRASAREYREAVPLLIHWLHLSDDLTLKEDIVRTLSVPWAETATATLEREFEAAPDGPSRLRWAIGNAIEVLSSPAIFEWLMEVVDQKRYGRDREMLVLALAKAGHVDAVVKKLSSLLSDSDVAGHALKALNRLRAQVPRRVVQPFLEHPERWVRQEAVRLLKRAL